MNAENTTASTSGTSIDDVRTLIHQVIREYNTAEKQRSEPAHKAELYDERRRREQLEKRVNELVEENQRSRAMAEEAERQSAIRSELQKHGVVKLDLAFKALKDDVRRNSDGRLTARSGEDEISLNEYVTHFVKDNPEFLPARLSGGSGAAPGSRTAVPPAPAYHVDIDKIRPGMDPAELERVREEVARIAMQSMSGRY